ncbi:MAG: hypothetical protein AB8B99_24615, partial [Phormidesmis sp.]
MEMSKRFNQKRLAPRSIGRFIGRLMLGFTLILYSVLMSVPWEPRGFSAGLDESYTFALYKAVAENFQFGRDFVYTYGPYGILQFDRYFPGTYTTLTIGRAFIGLVIGVGLCRITYYCWKQSRWSLLGLIPIFFSFPNFGVHRDSLHIYCTLLPLLIYFYVDDFYTDRHLEEQKIGDLERQPGNLAQSGFVGKILRLLSFLLLVVGIGLVGLIKQTFLVLGTAIVLLITLDQVFRKRQIPVVLVTYLASLLGFWLLAGQRLSNLGAYLENNAQITKGFSETMGVPGRLDEVLIYLVVASVLFVAIATITWQRHHHRQTIYRLLPIMGVLLVLFLVFKSAFTRHDGHALQASESIIPLASLYSALLWPQLKSRYLKLKFARANRPHIKIKVPMLVLVWALVIINGQFISSRYLETIYSDRYFRAIDKIDNTLSHAFRVTTGQATLQPLYDESIAQIKADTPLPATTGTTDLYPNNVAVLLAHELNYNPRPVIQSFSAYTGQLAALNAASLQSGNAPDTLLFDIRTIDGRFPNSDDGRSWPEIWAHYSIVDVSSSFLVLKRKAQPTPYEMTPQLDETVRVGEWIDIDSLSKSAPLWMNIDIHPTLAGKAATALLRRPRLYIEVELANGTSARYRVFEDLLNEGQLLSPVLTDRGDFAYLTSTNWQKVLTHSGVTRMRLVAARLSSLSYSSTYKLQLSRLDFPRQNLSNLPGWDTIESFVALRSGRITSLNEKQATVMEGPGGINVLLAQPGVKIALPLPENSQQFSISYGIHDEAWKRAQEDRRSKNVDGVEFRILAVPVDGADEN